MSSLFGSTTNQPANQSTGLFGSVGAANTGSSIFNKPGEQKPFSFGATQPQPQGSSLFGAPTQQNSQPQGSSLFGAPSQQNNPISSVFASQQTQQLPQPQRPFDQTLRFGASTTPEQSQALTQSLWEEGRGLGVYRSIPAQMSIVKDKWDAATLSSPLRTYVYQHVGDEKEALRYRPGPDEDEDKWEEAVSSRPAPEWVPLLIRGFSEMAKKAQLQNKAVSSCNVMLTEINNSLDLQMETHQQKVAARLAECKRRQTVASRRILALAVKVQILRNKGYIMDGAEEDLKSKLEKLERDICDPSLDAREQEIWARMLGIRERAKRLKTEMDRLAPNAAAGEPVLEEGTIQTAKEILEAYDTQLRHLHKELRLVQQEYDDWETLSKKTAEPMRRR